MARPSFKPTATQRTQVAIAAAGGMAHDDVAIALGVSRNTLEKHFERELSSGASKRRLSWLVAMDKAARGGNVAAQKALLATSPNFNVPGLPAAQPEKPEVAQKAPKVGKKEQAAADAVSADHGTGWDGLLPRAAPPTLQ